MKKLTDLPVLEFTLNATTYTAIEIPITYSFTGFTYSTKDGSQFYLAHASDATTSYLSKENQEYDMTLNERQAGYIVGYAKALSGTPVLQVLVKDL